MVRRHTAPYDIVFGADDYLKDKYEIRGSLHSDNFTQIADKLRKDIPVAKFLDIKHPDHPELSLFTEYASTHWPEAHSQRILLFKDL